MKVVVLVSGGMDSVTALYDANQRHDVVGAVSFHYGSKHNDREIPCAQWHCRACRVRHEIIELRFMDRLFESALLVSGGDIPDGHYTEPSMKKTVVPFRNGIMLAIAGGYAESSGAEGLVIAAHAGDHAIYPDCRPSFMNAMQEALRQGTYAGLDLLRPFIEMDKAAIARRGHELDVNFDRTWSCYKGGPVHCGACGTCVERREAFIEAGIPDPTEYLRTEPLPPRPAPETL